MVRVENHHLNELRNDKDPSPKVKENHPKLLTDLILRRSPISRQYFIQNACITLP